MTTTPPRRFLIFKVNHLGDNIVFLPVVEALRECFPDSRILVVTSPVEAVLYQGPLGATEIFSPCPRERFNGTWRRPWTALRWLLRLRSFKADGCLISYDQANFPHLLASRVGGPVRIGANMRYIRVRKSVTHVVPPPPDWNIVRWNWEMGRELAAAFGRGHLWPVLPRAPDLRHLLSSPPHQGTRKRVVIHGGSKSEFRRWPLEKFADLGRRLAADHDVIWINTPENRGVPIDSRWTLAEPPDLAALATVLASCDLYVGNNSGPMHMANALGRSGVIVSGPSSRGWDPYWYPERWTVLRHPALPCLPCEIPDVGILGCSHLAAPLACLHYWDAARVEAACRASLSTDRHRQAN